MTARVCLDMLRSRGTRREEPFEPHVPDPVVQPADGATPEEEALLADSVGLALLVVLETLAPAERLAFVLHDMFGVSVRRDRRDASTARRTPPGSWPAEARRRVQGATVPDADLARQREVVTPSSPRPAAATSTPSSRCSIRTSCSAPTVDRPGPTRRPWCGVRPRSPRRAISFSEPAAVLHPVLVNGDPGVVAVLDGEPFTVMGFTVANGRVVAIDVLADPDRLARLELPALGS